MSNRAQVLIVEPDEVTVMILERYFHRVCPGVDFLHAGTGIDAIQRLKGAQLPVLIIAEPALPDIPPADFIAALAAENLFAKTSVCLLSVLYIEELHELARNFPVGCYFSKPLSAAAAGQICTLIHNRMTHPEAHC